MDRDIPNYWVISQMTSASKAGLGWRQEVGTPAAAFPDVWKGSCVIRAAVTQTDL